MYGRNDRDWAGRGFWAGIGCCPELRKPSRAGVFGALPPSSRSAAPTLQLPVRVRPIQSNSNQLKPIQTKKHGGVARATRPSRQATRLTERKQCLDPTETGRSQKRPAVSGVAQATQPAQRAALLLFHLRTERKRRIKLAETVHSRQGSSPGPGRRSQSGSATRSYSWLFVAIRG